METPFTAKPSLLTRLRPTRASAAAANDFVMVEPISEEGCRAREKVEPAVRASNAASKFAADRPANFCPSECVARAAAATPQPAVNLAAEQKSQMSQAPAMGGPKYTGEPISVNLKDVDLKDFFRLVHEISGLNVVLDPNVKGSLTSSSTMCRGTRLWTSF